MSFVFQTSDSQVGSNRTCILCEEVLQNRCTLTILVNFLDKRPKILHGGIETQATYYRVQLMQTDVAIFVFVKNIKRFPPDFNLLFAVLVIRLVKIPIHAYRKVILFREVARHSLHMPVHFSYENTRKGVLFSLTAFNI